MSGYWTSSEALPLGAATGGRRRRNTKKAGRRHRVKKGGDELPAPLPAEVKEDAAAIAGAKVPKTMEAGRRRHTKAKKVAKALLKLSKKLEKGGRRRKH
uniref:Uncharacterized protein n=1 Tax=viral metagenome TaxID=1070528 RepID=A0A6C0CHN7_9ZZZZ